MKRIFSLYTAVIIFITSFSFLLSTSTYTYSINAATTSWPDAPGVHGETAVLIEASTGTILFDKKSHKKMYPASITKIMTALLTIENCKLDEQVDFSSDAINGIQYGDAHLECQIGEKMSVKDCLYGLMLKSANEVSTALGEHISGTTKDFAALMNERARQAGATDTNFVNANGLYNKNHYVTAYDMAMITRDALTYPLFREVTNTTNYTIPKDNKRKKVLQIVQRHQMVRPLNSYYYDGIIGGKTGYTDQSGTTLVTCAERDGMTLIAVVLNSSGYNVYDDTKKLFDYGFKNFNLVNVSQTEDKFSSSSYVTSNYSSVFNTTSSYLYISPEDNIILPVDSKISDTVSTISFLDKAEQKDGMVATIAYTYADTAVGSANLLYGNINSTAGKLTTSSRPTEQDTEKSTKALTTSAVSDDTAAGSKANNPNDNSTTKDKSTNRTDSSFLKWVIPLLIVIVFLGVLLIIINRQHKKLNAIRAAKRRRNH